MRKPASQKFAQRPWISVTAKWVIASQIFALFPSHLGLAQTADDDTITIPIGNNKKPTQEKKQTSPSKKKEEPADSTQKQQENANSTSGSAIPGNIPDAELAPVSSIKLSGDEKSKIDRIAPVSAVSCGTEKISYSEYVKLFFRINTKALPKGEFASSAKASSLLARIDNQMTFVMSLALAPNTRANLQDSKSLPAKVADLESTAQELVSTVNRFAKLDVSSFGRSVQQRQAATVTSAMSYLAEAAGTLATIRGLHHVALDFNSIWPKTAIQIPLCMASLMSASAIPISNSQQINTEGYLNQYGSDERSPIVWDRDSISTSMKGSDLVRLRMGRALAMQFWTSASAYWPTKESLLEFYRNSAALALYGQYRALNRVRNNPAQDYSFLLKNRPRISAILEDESKIAEISLSPSAKIVPTDSDSLKDALKKAIPRPTLSAPATDPANLSDSDLKSLDAYIAKQLKAQSMLYSDTMIYGALEQIQFKVPAVYPGSSFIILNGEKKGEFVKILPRNWSRYVLAVNSKDFTVTDSKGVATKFPAPIPLRIQQLQRLEALNFATELEALIDSNQGSLAAMSRSELEKTLRGWIAAAKFHAASVVLQDSIPIGNAYLENADTEPYFKYIQRYVSHWSTHLLSEAFVEKWITESGIEKFRPKETQNQTKISMTMRQQFINNLKSAAKKIATSQSKVDSLNESMAEKAKNLVTRGKKSPLNDQSIVNHAALFESLYGKIHEMSPETFQLAQVIRDNDGNEENLKGHSQSITDANAVYQRHVENLNFYEAQLKQKSLPGDVVARARNKFQKVVRDDQELFRLFLGTPNKDGTMSPLKPGHAIVLNQLHLTAEQQQAYFKVVKLRLLDQSILAQRVQPSGLNLFANGTNAVTGIFGLQPFDPNKGTTLWEFLASNHNESEVDQAVEMALNQTAANINSSLGMLENATKLEDIKVLAQASNLGSFIIGPTAAYPHLAAQHESLMLSYLKAPRQSTLEKVWSGIEGPSIAISTFFMAGLALRGVAALTKISLLTRVVTESEMMLFGPTRLYWQMVLWPGFAGRMIQARSTIGKSKEQAEEIEKLFFTTVDAKSGAVFRASEAAALKQQIADFERQYTQHFWTNLAFLTSPALIGGLRSGLQTAESAGIEVLQSKLADVTLKLESKALDRSLQTLEGRLRQTEIGGGDLAARISGKDLSAETNARRYGNVENTLRQYELAKLQSGVAEEKFAYWDQSAETLTRWLKTIRSRLYATIPQTAAQDKILGYQTGKGPLSLRELDQRNATLEIEFKRKFDEYTAGGNITEAEMTKILAKRRAVQKAYQTKRNILERTFAPYSQEFNWKTELTQESVVPSQIHERTNSNIDVYKVSHENIVGITEQSSIAAFKTRWSQIWMKTPKSFVAKYGTIPKEGIEDGNLLIFPDKTIRLDGTYYDVNLKSGSSSEAGAPGRAEEIRRRFELAYDVLTNPARRAGYFSTLKQERMLANPMRARFSTLEVEDGSTDTPRVDTPKPKRNNWFEDSNGEIQ